MVAVGPHGSTTPRAALRKLGVEVVVIGECEEAGRRLAECRGTLRAIPGIVLSRSTARFVHGGPRAADISVFRRCAGRSALIARHPHHHHRFDTEPPGRAPKSRRRAAVPTAAPSAPRKFPRPISPAPPGVDPGGARWAVAGRRYVYFIDEIFLPWRAAARGARARDLAFGVQTRIDLWKPRDDRAARPRRLRLDRSRGREPDRGRPRRARQEVPDDHRRTDPAPGSRQAATCHSCRPT